MQSDARSKHRVARFYDVERARYLPGAATLVRVVPDDDPRPELARLSERILEQERRDYATLLSEALSAAERPSPGSRWHVDRESASGNEVAAASLADGAHQFQKLMYSIADHADVLRLLMKHDQLLLIPAWTISRAILEPILLTCWLTDPAVTSDMRIARAASLLPGMIQGTMNQLAKFGEKHADELEGKRVVRAEIVTYYKRNDFDIQWATNSRGNPKDEISGVIYRGCRATINKNITQLAQQYLPDDAYIYGLLSGAAHGQAWLLNGLGEDVDEAIRSIMAPLMPISDAYTMALCGYLGIVPDWYMNRRQHRLMALMRRGSAVQTVDRSSEQTAFGVLSKGLHVDEISRKKR